MSSRSDEQLARESQSGSIGSFEELVLRYENRVYGFVLRACRNSEDAAEITQDTFLKAYQALAQFDPHKPLAPWLFTIARRKCIDWHRASPLEQAAPLHESTDLDNPADLLARKEETNSLWECAQRVLPHPQFQALWLRYTEEMNVKQIAQVLHKTQTHVKVLLFRARRRLIAELNQNGDLRIPASRETLHQESVAAKQALAHEGSARSAQSGGVENWDSVRTVRTL